MARKMMHTCSQALLSVPYSFLLVGRGWRGLGSQVCSPLLFPVYFCFQQ